MEEGREEGRPRPSRQKRPSQRFADMDQGDNPANEQPKAGAQNVRHARGEGEVARGEVIDDPPISWSC
jgi:hypothetical protein